MFIVNKVLKTIESRLEKIYTSFNSNDFQNLPATYCEAIEAHRCNMRDLIEDLKELNEV